MAEGESIKKILFWTLVVTGLAVKVWAVGFIGHYADMWLWRKWTAGLESQGLWAFSLSSEHNYSPIYLYYLYFFKTIYQFFFPLSSLTPFNINPEFPWVWKGLLLGIDILTVIILCRFVAKLSGLSTAEKMWVVCLYWLSPAFISLGLIWGQVEMLSFCGFLMALVGYMQRRYWLIGVGYFLALAIKLQWLVILPWALFWLYLATPSVALQVIGGFCASWALLGAPWWLSGDWSVFFSYMRSNSGAFGVLSLNAFGPWEIIQRSLISVAPAQYVTQTQILDSIPIVGSFTARECSLALFSCVYALAVLAWWRWRHQAGGPYLFLRGAQLISLAFFLALTRAHERYLFPYFFFDWALLLVGAKQYSWKKGVITHTLFGAHIVWVMEELNLKALSRLTYELGVCVFAIIFIALFTVELTRFLRDFFCARTVAN
jgi:hypothetical protein